MWKDPSHRLESTLLGRKSHEGDDHPRTTRSLSSPEQFPEANPTLLSGRDLTSVGPAERYFQRSNSEGSGSESFEITLISYFISCIQYFACVDTLVQYCSVLHV